MLDRRKVSARTLSANKPAAESNNASTVRPAQRACTAARVVSENPPASRAVNTSPRAIARLSEATMLPRLQRASIATLVSKLGATPKSASRLMQRKLLRSSVRLLLRTTLANQSPRAKSKKGAMKMGTRQGAQASGTSTFAVRSWLPTRFLAMAALLAASQLEAAER